MNARNEIAVNECATEPSPDHVRHSVQQLLASPAFAKAPRMCHLLSFLIEKKLSGREHEITEHAIGLAVFRRDARSYDTTLDPVVRVHVGRLRVRLATYYADRDTTFDVHVTIPFGHYVPCVSQVDGAPSCHRKQLQLAPLRCLSIEQGSDAFVRGVEEELNAGLFQLFGSVTLLREASLLAPVAALDDPCPQHRLEGSIRVEKKGGFNTVRVSMRLLDTRSGQLVWLTQFDRSGALCMTLQAELAGAMCAALQSHLASQTQRIFSS